MGRENLVEVIRQMARLTPQPPVIDLRQWLFAVYDIQREGLTIGEATWLAWLAQQIWPEANRRQLQQIRYEGAPRHFFEMLADSEREEQPRADHI